MRIYTKVGDGGGTRLNGGKKARKDDPRVRALGEVDELSAAVGLARALDPRGADDGTLTEIQRRLHVLGADLATPPSARTAKPAPRIAPADAAWAEARIDEAEASLPALTTFILPGGSPAGAALHLARAVGRRAERAVVALLKERQVSPPAQIFLNRLSDLLFVLARAANRRAGAVETPWP